MRLELSFEKKTENQNKHGWKLPEKKTENAGKTHKLLRQY